MNVASATGKFKFTLSQALLRRAIGFLKKQPRYIVPRSIKASLTGKVVGNNKAVISTPYFWAYYLHQGRGPMFHGNLIYFSDVRRDPRYRRQGGYARTPGHRSKLTSGEFWEFMAENRRLQKEGRPWVMHVREFVGEAKPRPFFYDGLVGFEAVAQQESEKRVRSAVKSLLATIRREVSKDWKPVKIPV